MIKEDGFSYPNKISRLIFNQLPIENLKFEYQSEWTKTKIYDVYFEYENRKYVVEIDGQQHYRDSKWTTLKEQQANDKYKDELAIQNNIVIIRINCKESKFYYIKNSFLSSPLNKIFNLESLDWQQIRIDSLKNVIIQVCNYYNENPNKTTADIAEDLKLNRTTVLNYLQEGAECGICNYTVEKAKQLGIEKRTNNRINNLNTIQIDMLDENDNFIQHFESINQAIIILNEQYPDIGFTREGIKQASLVGNLYKNKFKFIYVNELTKEDFDDLSLKIFEYYNTHNFPSLEEICNFFDISINSLRPILMKGKYAKLCNYDSQKSYDKTKEKRIMMTKKNNGYCFLAYKDSNLLGEFNSVRDFIKYEKENNIEPYMGTDKTRELIHDNDLEYKGWKLKVLSSPKRKEWK